MQPIIKMIEDGLARCMVLRYCNKYRMFAIMLQPFTSSDDRRGASFSVAQVRLAAVVLQQ
jgi:hypothetical protein